MLELEQDEPGIEVDFQLRQKLVGYLRESGISDIPMPTNPSADFFADALTKHENGDPPARELLFVAENMVNLAAQHHWGGVVDDEKAKLQLEIVDNEVFTPQKKTQLLAAFEKLLPIEGLDFTDEKAVQQLRDRREREVRSMQYSAELFPIVNGLVEKVLMPKYGLHDEYDLLASDLRFILTSQRKRELGLYHDEFVATVNKHTYNELLEIAGSIGIPESVIEKIIDDLKDRLK